MFTKTFTDAQGVTHTDAVFEVCEALMSSVDYTEVNNKELHKKTKKSKTIKKPTS